MNNFKNLYLIRGTKRYPNYEIMLYAFVYTLFHSNFPLCVFLSPPVLPLENVAGVFGVVPLTKKDDVVNIAAAAEWYVNEGQARSWREMAYYFNKVNETGVSDYIIPIFY